MTKRKSRNLFSATPAEIEKHTEKLLSSHQCTAVLPEIKGQIHGTRVKNLVTSPSKKQRFQLDGIEACNDSQSESIDMVTNRTQASTLYVHSDHI